MLPDQLRDQLVDLQHSMHDLKYHDEHHEAAAVRIQAVYIQGAVRLVCCGIQMT